MKRGATALISGLFLTAILVFMLFSSGCYSSGGKDLDPTTEDTCSIAEVVVLPENAVVSIGESITYSASAFSFDDERIVGGPRIYFSTNNRAVWINSLSGQIRTYGSTSAPVTITATAYDCSGRPIKGQATLHVYSVSPDD